MSYNDPAIRVNHLSKRYRIGLKEEMRDNFTGLVFDFIKSPLKNYRKYRSLYKFDENKNSHEKNSHAEDIIWALKDISFDVRKGEALGIIGRNGAGKSTLLKILCKITDPTSGVAEIRGRVSSLLEVGTGFHQELSGRENIYLNGTILGMTKKEVDCKFDEIVDFSGVEKFIDTPVKRYSSGMRVRLAFSVAAHLEPEILLIDEVLAVGDVDFQKKCLNKMENVSQEGRTVLFVSHNMTAIANLCNRTILLDKGSIIADGPSKQVVKSYLSHDVDTMAVREWIDDEEAPGSEVARLRAVRILDDEGSVAERIDIRKPVKIEMEYKVFKPGHLFLPHFALWTEKGQLAFITLENDQDWRQRRRPAGSYISAVWIPGNFLNDGLYYVNCHLLSRYPDKSQFRTYSIVAFQVIDSTEPNSARGDYAKPLNGAVRPLLEWKTQKIANEQKASAN